MLNSLAQQLLLVLVKIIVVVVGGFAIKYFNKASAQAESKMGQDKFEHYKSAIKSIVLAVEQQFPDLKGENKYIIAAEMVNKKFGNLLPDAEIKQLIEAAVAEINLVKKPAAQVSTPVDASDVTGAETANPTAEASDETDANQSSAPATPIPDPAAGTTAADTSQAANPQPAQQ